MKGDEGFMHAVVRHSVGTSVQAPSPFSDVSGAFTHHHAKSRWAAVKYHPFNHLFTPRSRTGNEDDVSVRKTMLRQAPAVLRLKYDDVVAEKTPLGSRLQIKEGNTGHDEALFGPCLPTFFHQLRFIVQFFSNEVRHRREVVLTSPPAVGSGFPFRHGGLRFTGAVHALD